MPSYDDFFKKKPVQPNLFEIINRVDLSIDGKANEQARLARKLKKQPTFMIVSDTEYKCLICKRLTNNPVYFKNLYCLDCDIFHDRADGV